MIPDSTVDVMVERVAAGYGSYDLRAGFTSAQVFGQRRRETEAASPIAAWLRPPAGSGALRAEEFPT